VLAVSTSASTKGAMERLNGGLYAAYT
jgi:hypothetical protein